MEQGSKAEGPSIRLMRLWLWAMPLVMLALAGLFAGLAAADGRWGLFAVMLGIGVFAVAMLAFHWWLLHRFGSAGREGRP